ncbi:hypothetical protein LTR85_004250 [Meristemomyces frigidus]|nr:hypothetical protein LTR85_004250 [Meristemomyces frigidus]
MLSSGSWTAPSACLRCQLRQVLVGLRPRGPAILKWHGCPQLSTTAFLRQEDAAQIDRKRTSRDDERSYVYRHIHPTGRIIGKAGRRQRQSFEQLATKSLGKPSEVIVLHDVVEEPKHAKKLVVPQTTPLNVGDGDASNALLSAEEIEAIVTGKQQPAEQEEVNTSIDALRPDSSVLEKSQFNGLVKQLLDSYNVRQLARYMVRSLAPGSASLAQTGRQAGNGDAGLHATQWQAGRTPLEQRIGRISLTKGGLGTTKAKLAHQIMRNTWDISIETEEQRLGELELYLKPWQMKMMFDLKLDDKPAIDALIDSPLLLRASDVRPYRPDNILRISARRRDAIEIVRQLQVKFGSVHRLDMDLDVFKPLLGRHGRPDNLKHLFRDEDIQYVSDRTRSVTQFEDGAKLAIYSLRDHDNQASQARRLLLSLLDLPSPYDTQSMIPNDRPTGSGRQRSLKTFSGNADNLVLNTHPTEDLHRRYYGKHLVRLTSPIGKCAETGVTTRASSQHATEYTVMGGSSGKSRLERLVGLLDTMPPPEVVELGRNDHEDTKSAWKLSRQGRSSPWRAEFCVLLRDATTSSEFKHPLIPLHQQPGLSQLLSYFRPVQLSGPRATAAVTGDASQGFAAVERTAPYLVAHYMPAPFSKQGVNAMKYLPRIAISSRVDPRTQKLQLFDVKARLKGQALQVPFPGQAVDLAFTRASTMYLRLEDKSRRRFKGTLDVFADRLQTSIQAGGGVLDAMAELDIKLPWWVAHRASPKKLKTEPKEDTAVPYLLDRLEQVQSMDFVPDKEGWQSSRERNIDPEVRSTLEQWPEGMILRMREVEAGASGGRRTELSLLGAGTRANAGLSTDANGQNVPDSGTDEATVGNEADTGDASAEKATKPTKRKHAAAEYPSVALTTTALRLLNMLTRANAGQLPLLTYNYDGGMQGGLPFEADRRDSPHLGRPGP